MKFVSYLRDDHDQLAFLVDGYVYDLDELHPELPGSMNMMLHYWESLLPLAQSTESAIKEGRITKQRGTPLETVRLLAPAPFPTSCRHGYAFRQHVAAARRNRKVEMIPEFDQYPVFYFTNHHSIQGGPGSLHARSFRKIRF
jgi:fumarylacetoacetate (FAA) hydrolase